ncbi:MAG: phosphohydrolase [Muribaculaceae bacterium]|nr:phosphohydrolase [Muribaculaceae bacterium]
MKGVLDINWLYFKNYSDNPELRRIVIRHSELVTKKALEINRLKGLGLDPKEIYIAGMVHDIGVVKCYAPDIHARGNLPYLLHGLEGSKMLHATGLSKYSKICLTHTGAGITADEIKEKNLPLPVKDLLPESLLEKLICYVDKFYSKSHDLEREKSVEEIEEQMKKFGQESLKRFRQLHEQFKVS